MYITIIQTHSQNHTAVNKVVTGKMNKQLLKAFTEAKETTLKEIHSCKSPGPDGMLSLFYKKYWHIVGPWVCMVVLYDALTPVITHFSICSFRIMKIP